MEGIHPRNIENFQKQKSDLLAGKGKWNDVERSKQIAMREKKIQERQGALESVKNEYKELLRQNQTLLREFKDPLDTLIADLIDLEPNARPTSYEAERRYLEYIGSQAFTTRFG